LHKRKNVMMEIHSREMAAVQLAHWNHKIGVAKVNLAYAFSVPVPCLIQRSAKPTFIAPVH